MAESKCLNGSSLNEPEHNQVGKESVAATPSPLVPETPKKVKPMTEKQELALQMILKGHKVKDAAAQLGVDRRTINRWMKHPRFLAAVERSKQALRKSLHKQLLAMVNTAFDALEQSMEKDEYQTALGLLKSLKILDPRPVTDSEEDSAAEDAAVNSAAAASDSEGEDAAMDAAKMGQMGHFTAEDFEEDLEPAEPDPAREMGHLGDSSEVKLLQEQVLECMEAGKSLAQSIGFLRISPATLVQWLRTDAEFKAAVEAYSEWTQGYWELRSYILGLLAVACLNRALQKGNGRMTLEVLRGLHVV